MTEHPHTNLTPLSPRDECLARVALANTPGDRLRLGLSVVVGDPEGNAVVLLPDTPYDEEDYTEAAAPAL